MRTFLFFAALNLFGSSFSQESHIIFTGKILDYHSTQEEINQINQMNISLHTLRCSFPFFDIMIPENKKRSLISWTYNFCLLSFMDSQRKQIVQEAHKLINSSVGGFIHGVARLESIDQSTLSEKAQDWLKKAKLWIIAYRKFENAYDPTNALRQA